MRSVIALLVVAVAAAACSEPDEPVQVVLDVVMADDWADTGAVIDTVRAFEQANPGVVVDLVPRPFNQIPDEVQDAMEAGRPVDVVQHHAFAAGAVGLAEPLDDLWADGTFDASDYAPGALSDVTWGTTRYGVPLDVNALFLVLDADLPPPATFDDVRDLAREAAQAGRRGMTVPSSSWETYGWVRANGGELVEVAPDGEPRFTLDSPAVVETLAFLGDLVADDLAYGPVSRDVSIDAYELFSAGDTQLLATGTWAVAALERTAPDRAHRTAVMPVGRPGGEPGSALGGSSLYVGRGSDDVELSVALITALTADDVALRLAREQGRYPARTALHDDLADAPGAEALAAQLPSAEPMRLIAFPAADAAFAAALDAVLTGRATAAEALARAQQQAEAAPIGLGS